MTPSPICQRGKRALQGGARQPAPASQAELWARAQALSGHTLGELGAALGATPPCCPRHSKGLLGRWIEDALGADTDAGEQPDFVGLGVELKTVPLLLNGRPKESTFVCSIHMLSASEQIWENSRLRQRLAHVLLIAVEAAAVAPWAQRKILSARLWRPQGDTLAALKHDWEDLIGAIGSGRGAALSAHEGKILQVRPKAANRTVRTLGPDVDGVRAMLPLGFYLRAKFMQQVLAGTA